jgi:RNA polymerase sigma-70 factor (ECF subfamily)
VLGLAARYLGSREEADDLAQEVFLKVYRARHRYRPEARFSTWLYRITVNLSLNWIRARKTRRQVNLGALATESDGDAPGDAAARIADEASPLPLDRLSDLEVHALVRRCLMELPERQRLVVVLFRYEGKGYQEISEILELSVTAVKSLLFRAREALRERLAPLLQERAETGGD